MNGTLPVINRWDYLSRVLTKSDTPDATPVRSNTLSTLFSVSMTARIKSWHRFAPDEMVRARLMRLP